MAPGGGDEGVLPLPACPLAGEAVVGIEAGAVAERGRRLARFDRDPAPRAVGELQTHRPAGGFEGGHPLAPLLSPRG